MLGDMLKVVIEEYVEKKRVGFYMPAIPWKWTLYDGSKVVRYGYCHTEEEAETAVNGALKTYRP
jgi:hypothetical protein